jgi:hypothetical protein
MKIIKTRKITDDIPPLKVECFSCKTVLYRKRHNFMTLALTNGYEVFCCDTCFDNEENVKYKFAELN